MRQAHRRLDPYTLTDSLEVIFQAFKPANKVNRYLAGSIQHKVQLTGAEILTPNVIVCRTIRINLLLPGLFTKDGCAGLCAEICDLRNRPIPGVPHKGELEKAAKFEIARVTAQL